MLKVQLGAQKLRRVIRYLVLTLVIVVVVLASALTPWSIQLVGYSVTANPSQDILNNGDFDRGLESWNITTHGSARYSLVLMDREDAATLQMEAEGTSNSNLTLAYIAGAPRAKIVPELAMKTRLRYLGSLTSGDSYLAIITFVIWNNASVIPLKIILGNFQKEVNAVLPSGVILTRTLITGAWSDIGIQFSRILPDLVSYLRTYTAYRGASIEDDFRLVGIAASVFNGRFLLDSLGLSMIRPAKIFINLTSNSLIPMNLVLKSVFVNGTNSFFIISHQAVLPFSTFEVISEILRPISRGETYVISLFFDTGQILQVTHRVDSAPRWI